MRQLRPQYCSQFLTSSRATLLRAAAMSQAAAGGRGQGVGEQHQHQQQPSAASAPPHRKLPKAYVRALAGDDKLTISLVLGGRLCNLERPIDEPVEKALFRMRANAAPKKKKGGKKDKGGGFGRGADRKDGDGDGSSAAAEPTVALFADALPSTPPIDPSTRNLSAWASAAVLVVGGERFAVRMNPPSVGGLAALGETGGGSAAAAAGGNGTAAATALSNCRPPMVGYPLLPVHELRFAEADCCSWRWLRRRVADEPEDDDEMGSGGQGAAAGAAQTWEETGGADPCYTPTEADLGCLLRVECVPARRHAGAAARAAREAAGLASLSPPADGGCGAATSSSSDVEHGEPGYAETSSPVARGPDLPAHVLRALAPAPAGVFYNSPASSAGGGAPAARPDDDDDGRCDNNPPSPSSSSSTFRVMSYNILANQYASNAYARTVLFGYCPPRFLAAEYRRQLVLAEVRAHAPDLALLQEVDSSAFADYYLPHLRRLGYEGRYTNKLGRVREGSATFWRRARFRLGAARDVDLRRAFEGVEDEEEEGEGGGGGGGGAPQTTSLHAQFAPLVRASPALAEALQKVTTIAQVTLLLPVDDDGDGDGGGQEGSGAPAPAPLVVANTHLFFHPYAPHIRTMHTSAILEEAAAALREWEAGASGRGQATATVGGGGRADAAADADALAAAGLAAELARRPPSTALVCGDLNSDLNDGVPGVVELLQTGRLSRDHWDWRCGAAFRWGKGEEEYADATGAEEEEKKEQGTAAAAKAGEAPEANPPQNLPPVLGVDVLSPFGPLRSADRLLTPYTNFTSGYKALLDYVWHDPQRLFVRRVLPAPPEALLRGFIPSEAFPSDHLAVVFDFDWVEAAGGGGNGDGGGQGGGGRGEEEETPLVASSVAAPGAAAAAAARLAEGGVVALPTDTLYGLAADARDAAAVAALKAAKGRDAAASPLAVAVADVADVARVADTSGLPEGLLEALLPGPVTVLLRPLAAAQGGGAAAGGTAARGQGGDRDRGGGSDNSAAAAPIPIPLALEALGARDKIGVRVPQCEFTRAACRALAEATADGEQQGGEQGARGCARGAALALTSANLSGEPSPLRASDFRALWPRLAAVYDGGPVAAASSAGSTVVDLSTRGEARILRGGVAGRNVARLLAAERFYGPLRVVIGAEAEGDDK